LNSVVYNILLSQ